MLYFRDPAIPIIVVSPPPTTSHLHSDSALPSYIPPPGTDSSSTAPPSSASSGNEEVPYLHKNSSRIFLRSDVYVPEEEDARIISEGCEPFKDVEIVPHPKWPVGTKEYWLNLRKSRGFQGAMKVTKKEVMAANNYVVARFMRREYGVEYAAVAELVNASEYDFESDEESERHLVPPPQSLQSPRDPSSQQSPRAQLIPKTLEHSSVFFGDYDTSRKNAGTEQPVPAPAVSPTTKYLAPPQPHYLTRTIPRRRTTVPAPQQKTILNHPASYGEQTYFSKEEAVAWHRLMLDEWHARERLRILSSTTIHPNSAIPLSLVVPTTLSYTPAPRTRKQFLREPPLTPEEYAKVYKPYDPNASSQARLEAYSYYTRFETGLSQRLRSKA
ncbi:hypothetical protein BT69DRAFT_1294891 [Atractiella rhizophila]|nr:hypothetical protein BT69DRAFT_1294891 [Atractiella rhizophila]